MCTGSEPECFGSDLPCAHHNLCGFMKSTQQVHAQLENGNGNNNIISERCSENLMSQYV